MTKKGVILPHSEFLRYIKLASYFIFTNKELNDAIRTSDQFRPISFNPRPGRGGCHPPLEVFMRCTPNYAADRAEMLHSLWGILCATFGKKKLTRSCQVTEL